MEFCTPIENETGLLKNDNHISCYINSILYILLNLPILSDFLVDNNNIKNVLNNIIIIKKKENIKKIKNIIKENNININEQNVEKLIDYINNIDIDDNKLKEELHYDKANSKDIIILDKIIELNISKDKYKELAFNSLTYVINYTFRHLLENRDGEINPGTLINLMKKIGEKNYLWEQYQQQDSSEYLKDIIDCLNKENGVDVKFIGGNIEEFKNIKVKNVFKKIMFLNAKKEFFKKSNLCSYGYSLFHKMLYFSEINNVKCSKCYDNRIKYEFTNMIQLKFPEKKEKTKFTLNELLINYISNEKLNFPCSCCLYQTSHTKSVKFFTLPKILILGIGRFNNIGQNCYKKTDMVDYPLELDMTKYLDNDSPYKDKNNKYVLVAVNLHIGSSLQSGHYVSIIKSRESNKWILYNDDNEPIICNDISQVINMNAFILFYYRVN